MMSKKTALPSIPVDTTDSWRHSKRRYRTGALTVVRRDLSPRAIGVFGAVLMIACMVMFALRTCSALP